MSRRLGRRTFLRGAALTGGSVAIGLPALDAMMNLEGTAFADGAAPPRRFVLWFWGNGTVPGDWAPAVTGRAWEPTALLRGLAPVRDKVSIVSGTQLPVRGMNNPHVEGACGILAGGNPLTHPSYTSSNNDWDFMTAPAASIDERAADLLGDTRFRSLVLGVTPLHGVSGPGTAVRYASHAGPYLPNEPTFDSAAVFARLFGGGLPSPGVDTPSPQELARASVLDAVLDDAASLDRRLGASDRARLEQHLEAIRGLERRLRATTSGMLGESCAAREAPTPRASYRAQAQVMNELVALAFACDLTRVAVMEFSSPASHSGYPDVFPDGIRHNGSPTSFHEYEHSNGFDGTVRTGLQYLVDVFGDHLATLNATPEAGQTLLDHGLVLGTSELSNGWQHRFDDFPLLLAGGAGGAVLPGQHIRLEGALASQMPLTILRALGSDVPSWGSEQFTTTEVVGSLLA